MARVPQDSAELRWLARVAAVGAFLNQHGRLPKPSDGDVGAWLSSQRSDFHAGKTSVSAARVAVLDRVAGGWREFLPAPGVSWQERVLEVARFRDATGRLPSQTASDPTELALATWLVNQRTAAHRGDLSDQRLVIMHRVLPGWDRGSREHNWYANADALGAFAAANNRWPSANAADKGERSLGSWLKNRRQDARSGTGWTLERAAYLERIAPGWSG